MILSDIEQREYNKYLEEFDFTEDIRNKTFLITGSKGIVGSGIIKWLLEENKKHNTNAHIIASTRNTKNIPEEYDDGDSIEWCEFGKEQEFCSDREINYIVHAAAPTSNKVFQLQPVESLKVILDGTQNMLDIAKTQDKCSMIFVSSEEAYGLTTLDTPIAENYSGGGIDSSSISSC